MKSFRVQVVETAALALLLCSLAAGQVSQCAATGSPQLRFVAQLNVNGCALFVHDTGASDGPHFAIEPVMCVTKRPEVSSYVILRPTGESYYKSLRVHVLLMDDGMLAAAKRQLEHLSPRSVSFLKFPRIKYSGSLMEVTMETNGTVEALYDGFNVMSGIWGNIVLRSRSAVYDFSEIGAILSEIQSDPSVLLNDLMLTVPIGKDAETCYQRSYRPMLQNQTFDPEVVRKNYYLPACQEIVFIRSINLANCTARVHQKRCFWRLEGHFLIEPLLCHNISSFSNESVMYDYLRRMYYLKLDVVLQDEVTLEAVRSQLADLSPRSVTFMKLWSAQSIVSSEHNVSSIGPLRVSVDWKTAQLLLFCRFEGQCHELRSEIIFDPVNLFRHIGWHVTAIASQQCLFKSDEPRFLEQTGMRQTGTVGCKCDVNRCSTALQKKICPSWFRRVQRGDRNFVKIMQWSITASVSFNRTLAEYEAGFGDETDFWIGFSATHSLSADGATLRLEMELLNGTELHAEYAGFRVGNASTKYNNTFGDKLTADNPLPFQVSVQSLQSMRALLEV